MESKKIIIDGIEYTPKGTTTGYKLAKPIGKLPYKIVRTYSAGVFAGFVKKINGQEVTLINARRLWYWEGANSLSQLAMEGTTKPDKCKFPCEVSEVILLQAIEILEVTQRAQESINGVPIWQKT